MYVSPPSFTKAISLWSSGVLNKSSPTTFTPVPVGGHRCARWRHYCRGAACEGTGAREQGAAPGQRNSEAGECFFCPGGARPPTQVLNDFVDKHRDVHGVEPICKVLQIAPSGYRRHAAQQRNPNLRGVRRGKVVRTTIGDMTAVRPLDRVNRQFKADRPSQLWVSDFTYASTWQGWQYVAFVIDVYARRIVGWRQSSSMRTDFVLDAIQHSGAFVNLSTDVPQAQPCWTGTGCGATGLTTHLYSSTKRGAGVVCCRVSTAFATTAARAASTFACRFTKVS